MGIFDKQHEAFAAIAAYMRGAFPADDPMLGAMIGSHSTSFSQQTYALAVSSRLLAMQALDRKLQPSKPLAWLQPHDITSATIWGEGGGFREWLATDSEFQLRFTTASGGKYKIMALGGWSMAKMMGQDYIDGLEAVGAWLDRARG